MIPLPAILLGLALASTSTAAAQLEDEDEIIIIDDEGSDPFEEPDVIDLADDEPAAAPLFSIPRSPG